MSEKFCAECKEDFPVVAGKAYRMGQLKPLFEAPPRLQERYRSWLGHEDGAYLCGNCYFDILDAEEDGE